jgi:hypothetical protein
MPINTFVVDFTNKAVKTLLPVVCGVPENALNGVDPKYVVRITATLGKSVIERISNLKGSMSGEVFTVYGFLQEKIVLDAGTDWKNVTDNVPSKYSDILKNIDMIGRAFSRTIIPTVFTRRSWAGSNPIKISMKLKFEAFSDPEREVIMPCLGLQGLTLPRGGWLNTIGLVPPGPNPFDFSLKGDVKSELGENIDLDIGGGFLHFNSVIVKDVKVTFENRMSSKGPIGAEVDISMETYQMLTREDLARVMGQSVVEFSGTVGQGIPSAAVEGPIG